MSAPGGLGRSVAATEVIWGNSKRGRGTRHRANKRESEGKPRFPIRVDHNRSQLRPGEGEHGSREGPSWANRNVATFVSDSARMQVLTELLMKSGVV